MILASHSVVLKVFSRCVCICVTDDNVAEASSTPGGEDGKPEAVVDNSSSVKVVSSAGNALPQSACLIGLRGVSPLLMALHCFSGVTVSVK